MKQSFTFFALLLGGAIQAQTDTFRMPPHYNEMPAVVSVQIPVGPRAILEQQTRQHGLRKTAASAYRMTGNSNYDHEAQLYLDSNRFVYSGTRGSTFADEAAVLNSGQTWTHSKPDFFANIKPQGLGQSMEIANRYNAANALTESIYRMDTWSGRYTYQNDASGQAAKMIVEDSTASGWVETEHVYYRYNAAGQRVYDSIWNVQSKGPSRAQSYIYGAAGRLDTTQSRQWNGISMEPNYRMVNIYDAAGNMTSTTNYFWDQDGTVHPGERFVYTYYPGSLMKESIMEVYFNGQWLQRQRDTVGYTDAKALYTYYKQEGWDNSNGGWIPFRDWTFTLNAQGRWDTQFYRDRNGSGVLVPAIKMTIAYDANGLLTAAKSYRYNIPQNVYEANPYEESRYYYEAHQTTAVKSQLTAGMLRAYPNPASLQLGLESPASAIEAVTILTTIGQRIPVPVVTAKTQQIDVSALPAGVYHLQLQLADKSTQTLRFVKQ